MLKDSLSPHQLPKLNDLSVPNNYEVEQILLFVDNYVPAFPAYYKTIKNPDRENRISDSLIQHFQLCRVENNLDYFPYDFRKNPTQPNSGQETDIGVFVLTRSRIFSPLIEFEAKRFSETSSNVQYVYGTRGGIERFKRGEHASHLKVCGMFAYVQSRTIEEWFGKVNGWIEGKSSTENRDPTIRWNNDEKLKKIITYVIKYESVHSTIEKYKSEHSRVESYGNIFLWHYFINLVN